MASGNHKRPPDQLSPILSRNLSGILPIRPCTPYSRLPEWCISGIIYHYAQFLIRNSMVTFSGPNAMFPNQGCKIQHSFQRRTLQHIILEIHGGYQKTTQGPQPPGPAGVGLAIKFRIIQQGPFSEVLHYFNQLSRQQVLQHPLDNPVGQCRYYSSILYGLGPIGPIQSHSSVFKMARAAF
ncbi:hypothetical protein O181_098628 [Austropuccinia psidii MF-1]|uniref:Uncharacterized protein n=1 Tax=Austropuccinia psidii MF-1 TaxID=1389203 RepID=A0A9Q3JB70_9BASI|nr:hypothetical protein [Austropuccinia psidii MF-1]